MRGLPGGGSTAATRSTTAKGLFLLATLQRTDVDEALCYGMYRMCTYLTCTLSRERQSTPYRIRETPNASIHQTPPTKRCLGSDLPSPLVQPFAGTFLARNERAIMDSGTSLSGSSSRDRSV